MAVRGQGHPGSLLAQSLAQKNTKKLLIQIQKWAFQRLVFTHESAYFPIIF